MRALLAALTTLMLFAAAPVVAGHLEDAYAGYKAGDYQKALRLWRPFAEQGDARAQYNLGLMYDDGEGVPEDDAKAVHWYRKAAEQGRKVAKKNKGIIQKEMTPDQVAAAQELSSELWEKYVVPFQKD